jgi:hypothetical protein
MSRLLVTELQWSLGQGYLIFESLVSVCLPFRGVYGLLLQLLESDFLGIDGHVNWHDAYEQEGE